MGKKGAIELQFNWVLVLVAGAVVLITFIGFISKQQEASSASDYILTASSLDAIFHTYSDADISDTVRIPKSKINFNCGSFSIGGISTQLDTLILFTPAFLETDKLHVLSFGWHVPYKITSFAYATSPEIRYIFIGDSDFASEMFEKVKGKMRVDGFTNVQAINNENDDRVRLVFFGQNPEIPNDLGASGSGITALKIDGNADKGLVEFFDFTDHKFELRGKSYYIGEASLFGAVFADGIGIYNCNIEKGFGKMKIVSSIYKKKIEEVMAHYNAAEATNICRNFYQDNLLRISDSISYLASSEFQSQNYEDIVNAANKIKEINDLADSFSCVLVY